jgi:hypothetical protein
MVSCWSPGRTRDWLKMKNPEPRSAASIPGAAQSDPAEQLTRDIVQANHRKGLMCIRGSAARRANMTIILTKSHMADAAARATPKINKR